MLRLNEKMRFFAIWPAGEEKKASEFDGSYWCVHRPELFPKRSFGVWRLIASVLGLGGVAIIGALLALGSGDDPVASSGQTGATVLTDSTQRADVKSARPNEPAIDVAHAPPDDASPVADFAPAATDMPQQPGVARDETLLVTTVDRLAATQAVAALPPDDSAVPETARAAPPGPDKTPIAQRAPTATADGERSQATERAKPPGNASENARLQTGAIARPKVNSPTKQLKRASAHLDVAPIDTTSQSDAVERPTHPVRLRKPAKPIKVKGTAPKTAQSVAKPQSAAEPQSGAEPQEEAEPQEAPEPQGAAEPQDTPPARRQYVR